MIRWKAKGEDLMTSLVDFILVIFVCVCVIVAIVGQKGLLRKSLTTCPQFSCFTAFLLLCIISCVNFLIRFCWVSQFLVGNASKKKPCINWWFSSPSTVGNSNKSWTVQFRRLCCEVKGGEDKSSSNFKVGFPGWTSGQCVPRDVADVLQGFGSHTFFIPRAVMFYFEPQGFQPSGCWNKVGVWSRGFFFWSTDLVMSLL